MERAPPFNVRLSMDIKEALENAASDDQRTVHGMVQKALTDWLTEHGYVKDRPRPVRRQKDRS